MIEGTGRGGVDDRELSHWLERRPLVVVEDHLHHVQDLLEALADESPELLAELSVVCLDRPGPDTEAALARWLQSFAPVRVATLAPAPVHERHVALSEDVLRELPRLAQAIAGQLRPGGALFQDVHLETLAFVPADRWWETIYVASGVRGLYAERPPRCRFLSNKRNYQATFGQELLAAGFDPRDVFAKDEMRGFLASMFAKELAEAFPERLILRRGAELHGAAHHPAERERLARLVDLALLAERDGKVELVGRALARDSLELDAMSNEAQVWTALIERDLGQPRRGLAVSELGARLTTSAAPAADKTNAASRMAYTLRGRLRDGGGVCNLDREYRLAEDWSVALVRPRELS